MSHTGMVYAHPMHEHVYNHPDHVTRHRTLPMHVPNCLIVVWVHVCVGHNMAVGVLACGV